MADTTNETGGLIKPDSLKETIAACETQEELEKHEPGFWEALQDFQEHEKEELLKFYEEKKNQLTEVLLRTTTRGVYDDEDEEGAAPPIQDDNHSVDVVVDQPHLAASIDEALTESMSENLMSQDSHHQPPPAPTLLHQFEKQFCTDEFVDKLKHQAFAGTLHMVPFRSVAWKFLLGTLTADFWKQEIKDQRDHFDSLCEDVLQDPRLKSMDQDHPLDYVEESGWSQHFQNQRLRDEIFRDVDRTFPEIPFFSDPKVAEHMVDLLFLYAKLNPDIMYRQGMHELLAPILLYVEMDIRLAESYFESDSHDEAATSSASDDMKLMLDRKYLLHDTYTMFSRLMSTMKDFYSSDELVSSTKSLSSSGTEETTDVGATHLQVKLQHVLSGILHRADKPLFEKMRELDIAPMIYGIRWVRLLFTRELPLQDALCVWDAIFAVGEDFEFIDHICASLLIFVRRTLLGGDYTDCLSVLMRYPDGIDVQRLLAKALHLRQPMHFPDPSNWHVVSDQEFGEANPVERLGLRGFSVSDVYEQCYETVTAEAIANTPKPESERIEEESEEKYVPRSITGPEAWKRKFNLLDEQHRAIYERDLLLASALQRQIREVQRVLESPLLPPNEAQKLQVQLASPLFILSEIQSCLKGQQHLDFLGSAIYQPDHLFPPEPVQSEEEPHRAAPPTRYRPQQRQAKSRPQQKPQQARRTQVKPRQRRGKPQPIIETELKQFRDSSQINRESEDPFDIADQATNIEEEIQQERQIRQLEEARTDFDSSTMAIDPDEASKIDSEQHLEKQIASALQVTVESLRYSKAQKAMQRLDLASPYGADVIPADDVPHPEE